MQVISEEVTLSMGLVTFFMATGSLIGPLAVSNQYHLSIPSSSKVGGVFDTYDTYSPGFLGVGTLGVLGALILPAIAIALPPRKNI